MSTGDQSRPLFEAGDTVYTLYGAGVIVSTEPLTNSVELLDTDRDRDTDTDTGHDRTVKIPISNADLWFTVRLWRLPNRSVGSSALAKLRSTVVSLSFHLINSHIQSFHL